MKSKVRGFIRRPFMAAIVGLVLLGTIAGLAFGEVIQGQLVGPFGNTIDTRTEGQFLLHRSNAGTVTITATDSDANASLTIDPGGTGTLTLGSADTPVTVSGSTFTYSVAGGLTLANGETLHTDTDAVFDFTRNDAGVVTLTASDTDATAALTLRAGGAAALTLGGTTGTDWIGLTDTDFSLRNGATGNVTLDFRDYADSADDDMAHVIQTVNCTDAATGTEDCDWTLGVVEAGAAAETRLNVDADGDITIGSANNGGIIALGTGAQFRNSATGSVTLDWRDYADTADDDMAHALVTVNCTDATTGAEDCDWTLGVVEAGAAAETRLAFDADGDNTLGSANSANNVSLSTELQVRNSATGNVDLSFRDYADSADDDMAHTLLRTNCTDATTGAEDCDFTIGIVEAGAAAETRLNFDADGDTTLGSATSAALISLGTGTSLRNSATGNVVLDFRDYADSADDDMAHAEVLVNCTDATTGAEDCDYSIGVVEAGAANDVRFSIDADAGVTIGSATNASFTVTTTGSGDTAVVLPLQSIAAGEILDDTITPAQLADTLTLDAALVIAGAFSIDIGNNAATTIALDTDGTGDAELVLPDGSVSALEIVDTVRAIPLPLGSWVPCAGAVAGIWDASGADTAPDLVAVNTALVIAYDDTGGSVDTAEICNAFTVPDDYVSGGSFQYRFTKDGATVLEAENWACRISVDGAAIGAATTTATANQTAAQTVSQTPAGTWAAGASIGIACSQSNASADDTLYMHGAHAEYTATN